MARALLTEGERRHIRGESDTQQRQYEAVSRVRSRAQEHLTDDIEILIENHRDLWSDIIEAVGPIYYCPRCGDGFPRRSEAVNHAIGTTDPEHEGIDTDWIGANAPEWWGLDWNEE